MEHLALILWITYILGVIISYPIVKWDDTETWADVVVNLFMSLFSWLGIFVHTLSKIIAKFPKTPPKWLR